MKLVAVSGSRTSTGQTGGTVAAFCRGFEKGGGSWESVLLPTVSIERCRQCDDNGWGKCKREGSCVIEDDFASIVDTLVSADAVVFATPVYFSDLSESIRSFLDRLRRITRSSEHEGLLEGKPAVGICVAGGGGGGAPSCVLSLEKIVQRCGFDILDLIPVRRQNLEHKLGVLESTGEWLAAGLQSR